MWWILGITLLLVVVWIMIKKGQAADEREEREEAARALAKKTRAREAFEKRQVVEALSSPERAPDSTAGYDVVLTRYKKETSDLEDHHWIVEALEASPEVDVTGEQLIDRVTHIGPVVIARGLTEGAAINMKRLLEDYDLVLRITETPRIVAGSPARRYRRRCATRSGGATRASASTAAHESGSSLTTSSP